MSSILNFTFNNKSYQLDGGDGETIAAMTSMERRQLIKLLKPVYEHERQFQQHAKLGVRPNATIVKPTKPVIAPHTVSPQVEQDKPEVMGHGDADDLMARLIAEEQQNRKAIPSKNMIYKYVGVISIVVILLILIF